MRHPLSDRAIAAASVDRAVAWWDSDPVEIRRPDGSALHKLVDDWNAGIVVIPNSGVHLRDMAARLITQGAVVFLIQHDWAGAIGHAIDFAEEYRLPFPLCAFECDISGHRVIYIEEEGGRAVLAVHSGRHWIAFPFSAIEAPSKERETGLPGLLQTVMENVRALTIVLDAGAADIDRVTAPAALNKSRARSGKQPLSDYHVVNLSRHGASSELETESSGGSRPRLHFRRGHWRHLEGSRTWIRWTLAGDASLGFVDKRYKL